MMGFKIVLDSGRSVWEVYSLAMFLGTTRTVVAENGGVVAFSPNDLLLLSDRAICMEAYEILAKEIKQIRLRHVFPRLTEVVVERNFNVEEARRIVKDRKLKVTISDSLYGYHICFENVNKASGFERVLRRLEINWDETVAIGDSETDVPLFDKSGYSVALGNSPPSVKDKAKYSVRRKMGNGLVDAVSHIGERFLAEFTSME